MIPIAVQIDLSKFERDKREIEVVFTRKKDEVGREIAKEVLERIRKYVPVRTGKLRDSFKIEELPDQKWRIYSDLEYALYIEKGISSHFIEAKRAKYLRFEKEGEVHFAKRVWHPGFLGRRYVERAVDDMVWYAPQIVVKAFSGVL